MSLADIDFYIIRRALMEKLFKSANGSKYRTVSTGYASHFSFL